MKSFGLTPLVLDLETDSDEYAVFIGFKGYTVEVAQVMYQNKDVLWNLEDKHNEQIT